MNRDRWPATSVSGMVLRKLTLRSDSSTLSGMQTAPDDSTPRSSGSDVWTPERIERMRRQDQASARIRRALGQIVTEAGHWQRSQKAKVQSSVTTG